MPGTVIRDIEVDPGYETIPCFFIKRDIIVVLLQKLHELMNPEARGQMVTLDTTGDRTLYFDFLPVEFGTANGFSVKIKLFTVPGQVMHKSTRKVVLSGADAVAFIADSQRASASAKAALRVRRAAARSPGLSRWSRATARASSTSPWRESS